MVRNPNELQRLEEELEELNEAFYTKCHSKKEKELVLREIRQVERRLGLDSKPYNGV